MKKKENLTVGSDQQFSLTFEIAGTADLIQNNFSQKSVEQMLKKHMGITVKREPKKPREILEDAKILNTDGRVCIPPTAIKMAMLTASTQVKGFKKTQLRTALFIVGSSLPITYKQMVPRMDIARLSGPSRTPDVRFRPAFVDWKSRLTINFAETLSVESVCDLLQRAGRVGVGEWRPEKNGPFGTFRINRHITDPREIGEVEAECAVPLKALVIPDWAMDANVDLEMISKIMTYNNGQEAETEEEEVPDSVEAV